MPNLYDRQNQPYSNQPHNPMTVPRRVLGAAKKVVQEATGKTVQTPDGESQLILETSYDVCPDPEVCETDCWTRVYRGEHLDVSWEGDFVFITQTVTIPGVQDPIQGIPVTVDAAVFQVLEGWTFFVEKLLIQPMDSAWESLQVVPTMDGSPILAPYSNTYNLMPLLPQGQRNTRWEVDSAHTFGIRLVNYQACSRVATVGYVGWIERLKCNERRNRS
jgi:hypothetical protein